MPSQDTFSFALVLLCLAVGEIDYVVTHVRNTSVMYAGGARPPIPESLDSRVAQLVQDMWQGEFRLRPAMSKVVERIEAYTSLQEKSSIAVTEQAPADALEDPAKIIAELRAENARLRALNQSKI